MFYLHKRRTGKHVQVVKSARQKQREESQNLRISSLEETSISLSPTSEEVGEMPDKIRTSLLFSFSSQNKLNYIRGRYDPYIFAGKGPGA